MRSVSHPNVDIIKDAYAAFRRGDRISLRQHLLVPDVRWHFAGYGPLSGDYKGVEQLMAWFDRRAELSGGTVTVDLHDVIGNDEHVVALTTIRAARNGKQLEDRTMQLYHMKDGRVTEAWSVPSDQRATDEFWS